MQKKLFAVFAMSALALVMFPDAASAQAAQSSVPTYVVVPMEITVNRPAAEVWKRVGGYCAISDWLRIPNVNLPPCTIVSGRDNEIGAVRSVGNEILVGKSDLSYTYTQAPRAGQPYNLYHGTLEARPVTASTSKLVYTLFFDDSMLPDAAAREANKARFTGIFTPALANMKILAEGGTVPPAQGSATR